jgi:hypothetical protein
MLRVGTGKQDIIGNNPQISPIPQIREFSKEKICVKLQSLLPINSIIDLEDKNHRNSTI